MHKCAGWCTGIPGEEEYRNRIDQAVRILEGKSNALLEELRSSMEAEAESLNFENAAELRDRISLINLLANKQRVISLHYSDLDAVGFARGYKSCFTVLSYSDGTLVSKHFEVTDEPTRTSSSAFPGREPSRPRW